jgi:hypothetical protein
VKYDAARNESDIDFAPVHTTDPDANVSAVVRGSYRRIVAAVNFDELYSRNGIDSDKTPRSRARFSLNVETTLSIRNAGILNRARFVGLQRGETGETPYSVRDCIRDSA